MGARQVLRVAVAIAIAAGARRAHAQPRGPLAVPAKTAARPEPVIVIDVRAPSAARDASRATLGDALDRTGGIDVQRGGMLDAALAGDRGGDGADAAAALDEAKAAYGALDCAKARPAAERAAIAFAARQASGLASDDGVAPRAAWAYVLLCADRDGDHARAAVAATMLRALGVRSGGEAGIGADAWARYPDADARTAPLVELTIKASPGADVWLDLAKVGAPGTYVVSAGDHVIAAALGPARAAQSITIDKAAAFELALVDRSDAGGAWADVAAHVHEWRKAVPAPDALAAIMREVHVRFAFVVDDTAIALWVLGPGDQVARRVDTGAIDDPKGLAAMVATRVDAWDGRASDPDRPLLVDDKDGKPAGKAEPDHWWVYASLIGAVVVGGLVVYEHDSAQDHQRIELRYP